MAKDKFHDNACNALVNDGWTITNEEWNLEVLGFNVKIDIAAERLIAATKNNQKIAVEVKSFLSQSPVSQFHMALGQFLNYRDVLENVDRERKLYLAIPKDAYLTTFQIPFILQATERYGLTLLVYEPAREVIVEWKN
ncbi:MAG: element excision factor XisH family protein [Chloroflexota bacterium]